MASGRGTFREPAASDTLTAMWIALLIVLVLGAAGVGVMVLLSQGGDQKRPTSRASGPVKKAKPRLSTSSYRRKPPAWMRVVPFVLVSAAVASLILALTGFRFSREEQQGTAYLVMDVSNSMNQTDVTPSRLEVAQEAAGIFLERLPEDVNVSLVTFSGNASVVVAPTTERGPVEAGLTAITTDKGTVIGDGLTAALDTYEAERIATGTGPAAVVLLSDGRDTGSTVAPEDAAVRAGNAGVPVFTVVLGSAESDGKGGANFELLEQMASETGAETYTAQTASELTQVYEAIGTRLSLDLAISDTSAFFVIVAAALAMGAAVIVLLSTRSPY